MSKAPTRIVLLEDDDMFSQWICDGLKDEFGEHLCVIEIATESDFWGQVDQLVSIATDAFILDVRVRWTHPGSKVGPPPPEKADQTAAGLRCSRALRDKLPGTPVLLFSVLEKEDLKQMNLTSTDSSWVHIPKSEGVRSLIYEIRRQLK